MKQETGNSRPIIPEELSIRLRADGHSFPELSQDMLRAQRIRCSVVTHKTVLIPSEFFDRNGAATALRLAGLECSGTETAVYSDPQAQQIAVMALDKKRHEQLCEAFGDRLSYTSPLLFQPKFTGVGVWLMHIDGILYIKLYDKVLRVAEAVRAQGTADILYYLGALNRTIPLRDYPLCLSGGKTLARQLRVFFRDVRCE